MGEPDQAVSYEFLLHVVDPEIGQAELYRLLEEAMKEAAEAMSRDEEAEVDAKAEVRGAFGGVGEMIVALVVAFAAGAAKKIGEKSGEYFFSKYLELRLKKRNLIPRSFRRRQSKNGDEE